MKRLGGLGAILVGGMVLLVSALLMGIGGTRDIVEYTLSDSDWLGVAGFNGTSPDSILLGGGDTTRAFNVIGLKNIHVFVQATHDSSGFHIDWSANGSTWTETYRVVGDTLLNGTDTAGEQLLYIPVRPFISEWGASGVNAVTNYSGQAAIIPHLRFRWINSDATDTLTAYTIKIIGEKR